MRQDEDREQRIRERAFQLWIEDGRPFGKAEEHWERARVEIEGQKDKSGETVATPPKDAAFGP
jgi:hypothetical protein